MNMSTEPTKIELEVIEEDNLVKLNGNQEQLDFLRNFFYNMDHPNIANLDLIINKDATVLVDKTTKQKTVVKKYYYDEDDREKAVLYALLKMQGIMSDEIMTLLERAKDYRK